MRSFSRLSAQQHGYTFNEILVAMAVTGIALLGYAATTMTVIRGNRASENYTIAVNLAQDKIEQLKSNMRLSNSNYCPAAGDLAINARGAAGGRFNRCWKIADSALASNLKEIEVTVDWYDTERRAVTLTTLILQE
jgi:Tfp pilus assembly protein PilV